MFTFPKTTLVTLVAIVWAAASPAQESGEMTATIPTCIGTGTQDDMTSPVTPCFEIVPVPGGSLEIAGGAMAVQTLDEGTVSGFASITIPPSETDQLAVTTQTTIAEPLADGAWESEEIALVELAAEPILAPTDEEPIRIAIDEDPIPLPQPSDPAPDPAPVQPPVQPEPQPTLARALEAGQTVRFRNILFAYDSANLKPESRPALAIIAEALRASPDIKVVIEGHTDSEGSDDYNLSLSQRRAEAVVMALINTFKIDASRLRAVGRGESTPITSNASAAGRAQNRRVEIKMQE